MKSPLYIKFCGMTNSEDAEFAADSGADAIGFITYPKSPRYVCVERVADIINSLNNSNIQKVGVFVDSDLDTIEKYIDAGINTLQLHGNESPAFAEQCAGTDSSVWKVIKPRTEEDILSFRNFPADRFLLDAFHKDLKGGTGIVIDSEIAKFAVDTLPAPVLLAGGISPGNCVEICKTVKPFGLDVNSGVEISPGVKNHDLIKKLFENINLIISN